MWQTNYSKFKYFGHHENLISAIDLPFRCALLIFIAKNYFRKLRLKSNYIEMYKTCD